MLFEVVEAILGEIESSKVGVKIGPMRSERRDPADDGVISAVVMQEMKSPNNSQKVQIAGGCSKFLPIASCTALVGIARKTGSASPRI